MVDPTFRNPKRRTSRTNSHEKSNSFTKIEPNRAHLLQTNDSIQIINAALKSHEKRIMELEKGSPSNSKITANSNITSDEPLDKTNLADLQAAIQKMDK